MAQITTYADYAIFFQDLSEYNFAVSVAGGNRLLLDPFHAASLFNIPWPLPSGNMETIPKGMYGFAPFGIPAAPGPGVEVLNPGSSGKFLHSDQPNVLVPGQAGNPASVWPKGPDNLVVWAGTIIKSNAGAQPSSIQTPIPPRRWINGFEFPNAGEGGTSSQPNFLCRDASRTTDGIGMAVRGQNITAPYGHLVAEIRTGLSPHTSWERFYVRFRTPGNFDQVVWQCFGLPSPQAGFAIVYKTTGVVEGLNVNSVGGTLDAGAIFTPIVNKWYLIDVLLKFDSGIGTDGRIRIYINHVFTYFYMDSISFGLNANTSHNNSSIGRNNATVDTKIEYDIDDWMCSDVPANYDANLSLIDPVNINPSIDFVTGSHIRPHYSTSVVAGAGWNGSLGALNQGISSFVANSNFNSTASGQSIDGTTDVNIIGTQDSIGAVLGPVSAVISEESLNSGSTHGQLGYKIAGGSAVLITINQTNTLTYFQAGYFPSGFILPNEISPFHVFHQKSADGNTDTVNFLQSIIEYIGVWGQEDDPTLSFEPQTPHYLHNCRYANTVWGNYGPVPNSPVYAVGGTYTGNGAYQEILLPAPCHFLWIRASSGGSLGVRLFGAGLNALLGSTLQLAPSVRLWTDLTGQCKFSVNGTNVEINQNTTVYQYIAFCDPGMRFNYCGSFQYYNFNQPRTNILLDPNFLPQAAFSQAELSNTFNSGSGLFYKGSGMSGSSAIGLSTGSLSNFGTFNSGIFSSDSGLATNVDQINFSLWRTSEILCAGVMCQIYSYTGDGNIQQIVNSTPVSGRFPLFILVLPTTGGPGFFRDPSHVGNASMNTANLSLSSSAIISAGLDTITVGSTLNVLNTIYSVFIIPGDSTGMNNGIFFNPNCLPPNGTREIPQNLPSIAVLSNGGLILGALNISTLLKDISGLYTLIPGKTNDTMIDRQAGQTSIDLAIPNPNFKTGYIGG